jgi:hypothetical protein
MFSLKFNEQLTLPESTDMLLDTDYCFGLGSKAK